MTIRNHIKQFLVFTVTASILYSLEISSCHSGENGRRPCWMVESHWQRWLRTKAHFQHLKMATVQCTISAVTMMAINQVENLIDRVWTEENGRPPNTHKKVFIEEQWSFQWCVNVNQDCQLKIMQVVVHQMKFAGESWQDKVIDIKVKVPMIGIMAQYRNPGWTPADWFGRARLGRHGCHWAWRGFEVVLVKTEQFCFIQRENFPEKKNNS